MKIFILFLVIFVIYYSFNYYENFYSYGQDPEVFPIGSLSQEGASRESTTVNISCDDINDSVQCRNSLRCAWVESQPSNYTCTSICNTRDYQISPNFCRRDDNCLFVNDTCIERSLASTTSSTADSDACSNLTSQEACQNNNCTWNGSSCSTSNVVAPASSNPVGGSTRSGSSVTTQSNSGSSRSGSGICRGRQQNFCVPPQCRWEPTSNMCMDNYTPPGTGSGFPVTGFYPTVDVATGTGYYQPPTGDYQPPTGDYQPPTGYYQPPTGYYQPPTGDYQPPA